MPSFSPGAVRRRAVLAAGLAASGAAAFGFERGAPIAPSRWSTGETMTSKENALQYNNFYEFGPEKSDPARYAAEFEPQPWSIVVEGECARPGRIGYRELAALAPLEERVYRLRCVEAWSMVVPWIGFGLSRLLERFEPTPSARYVMFQTVFRPAQMRGQRTARLQWPYREALRLDEAMHPLALLALGAYGDPLAVQSGAPVRIVVPWKYGFKSAKSIDRIVFTSGRPSTTWNEKAPAEYGFYANVNPRVDHPRWSQRTERRLTDQTGVRALFVPRIETRMFNGYAADVSALYAGMDLSVEV